MSNLLTISVPTYNRLPYLKKCLSQLLPQVEKYKEKVNVFVTDNCSTDDTKFYMEQLVKEYTCITYHRNEKNLGYSGNQINCIQMSDSIYTAILCDDDIYLDGAVDEILNILNKPQEWSMLAINYYGFKDDFRKPSNTNFAPTEDRYFSRPLDLMNYPSVGHYSGLIFNSSLAKQIIQNIIEKYDYKYYEQQRGVLHEAAFRVLSASKLPAYFIGKRILANNEVYVIDYDSLSHLCIEYFRFITKLYNENVINNNDLVYHKKIILDKLPRYSFSSLLNKKSNQVSNYWYQLENVGLIIPQNYLLLKVIFTAAKFSLTNFIMRLIYKLYRISK